MPPSLNDSTILADLRELIHRYNIDGSFRMAIDARLDQGNFYWNRRPLKLYLGVINQLSTARYKPQVQSLVKSLAQSSVKSDDIKQKLKQLFNSFEYDNKGDDWQTLHNQIANPVPKFQEIQNQDILTSQLPNEAAQSAAHNNYANLLLSQVTPLPPVFPGRSLSTTAPTSSPENNAQKPIPPDSNLSLGLAIDRVSSPDEVKGLIERINRSNLSEMQKLNLLASAEFQQGRLLKPRLPTSAAATAAPNVAKAPGIVGAVGAGIAKTERLGRFRLPRYLQNSLSSLQILIRRRFPTELVLGGLIGVAGGGFLGGGGLEGIVIGAAGGVVASQLITKGDILSTLGARGGSPEIPVIEDQPTGDSSSGRGIFHSPVSGLFSRGARRVTTGVARKGLLAALLPEEAGIGAIILIVVLIIAAAFVLFILVDKNDKDNPFLMFSTGGTPSTAQAAVIITKSGPASVNNKQDINYELSVSFTGAGSADIEVVDHLPANSTAKNISDNGTSQGQTITWELSGLSFGQNHKLTFTLTPDPNKSNFWVVNYAEATIKHQSGSSNSTFDSLMSDQGRNTNVLGDENSFVATLIKRGPAVRHDFSSYEPKFRQIYETATAKNVNPLILATIWNVEVSFDNDGKEFSCPPGTDSGFTSELNCAVNTLNDWMNYFNENKQGRSYTFQGQDGQACTYTDPFLFAYEKYTPVCDNDQNPTARGNFVDTYTKLLGK